MMFATSSLGRHNGNGPARIGRFRMALSADPSAIIPMSWVEYEAWEPLGDVKGEYLDGVFVMARAASIRHARISLRLARLLDDVVVAPYAVLQEVEWVPDGQHQASASSTNGGGCRRTGSSTRPTARRGSTS
jgi:hypothetical protein